MALKLAHHVRKPDVRRVWGAETARAPVRPPLGPSVGPEPMGRTARGVVGESPPLETLTP